MPVLVHSWFSRRRRRSGGRRNGPVAIVALCISGGGLLLVGGFLLVIWVFTGSAALEPAGPIPTCEKPSRVRVFVLDSSDPPISPSQAVAIDALIKRFLDEGRMADRVMVGRLTPSMVMPLEILWIGCDPGQEFEHSQLRVTPQEARKRREKLLVSHVRSSVELAKVPSPTPLSPIAASWSMLFKDQRVLGSAAGVVKVVYYVTDALEHLQSPLPSAYRRDLNTPKAKAYFASLVTSVSNTKVKIGLLHRPEHKPIQDGEAKPWLASFLKKSGVEAIEWVELW
jgi:hypothetical protein